MTTVLDRGLTAAEVRERVAAGQVNAPPATPGRTVGQILRANVLTRFNAILGALFVLVMIVGPPQDALFVLLTSVAFAAGALRLARRRVLVSELAAIEGLARVDVLCTDKTGTLTRPGMRLAATEVLDGQPAGRISEILAAVAAVEQDPNPTVRAIASGCADDPGWPVQARVPFSSARKWSGVSFTGEGTWLLGAPSVVGGELPAADAAAIAVLSLTNRPCLTESGRLRSVSQYCWPKVRSGLVIAGGLLWLLLR